MNVLIIGGTSLFGKYSIPIIVNDGNKVVATKQHGQDYAISGRIKRYTGKSSGVEWEELDVLDKESIVTVLRKHKPDIIYDFAVQNSVGYAWEAPSETVDINIIGALNLFDAVRSINNYKPTILMAGSGEEYGRNYYDEMPLSETLQPKPNNIFASSKVCQSLLANIYYRAYNMNIITLRTFNEIGPGMSDRFSVSNFCKQFAASKGDIIELYVGNVNIERDYTDVRDLVNAFIALADRGRAGEVYNAGRGSAVPIIKVVRILEEISDKKAKIIVDADRIRPIDTPKLESNNRKIELDTGWKTRISLKDTIKDMYEYWLN